MIWIKIAAMYSLHLAMFSETILDFVRFTEAMSLMLQMSVAA